MTRPNMFMQDSDGFFWIGGNNGLHKYDGYTFKHYIAGPDSVAGNDVGAKQFLWIGSVNGLYKFDPNNKNSLSNNTIGAIMEDLNGILWISTVGGGLNLFDKNTGIFTRYSHSPSDPNSIDGNNMVF